MSSIFFFFSSRRRHTRFDCDWSSDVCSSDLIAGIASTHLSNILESCRFAPLTKITSGMPLASTTMCRLEPSLPLSVGFGPVSWPPGGLVLRSHQCWPGSNRFGHVHASESAWLGAAAPRHQRHSSRADAASKSCRCRSPGIGEGLPMECRSEEHTSELQSQSNLVCRLLLEKKKSSAARRSC